MSERSRSVEAADGKRTAISLPCRCSCALRAAGTRKAPDSLRLYPADTGTALALRW